MRNENGYVLIATLLILCLLTITGISAMRTSTTEMAIATNHVIHEMEFYASEAGITHSISWLRAGGVDETDYTNADYEGNVVGNLENKTSYSTTITHQTNSDGDVLLYGDADGDFFWEVNTTNGRPLEIILSEGTHPRGGQVLIEARVLPTPPFIIPDAALWVHSNVNGNGVSGAIVGEGPSDDSLFSKDYYDSDYDCPAVPDIKHQMALPMANIEYDGNTGANQLYQTSGGLYPLAMVIENLKKQADHVVTSLPGNKFPSDVTFGDKVIVIDMADAKVSQNVTGSGILICNGNLEISGNLKWKGLILVNGNVTMNGGGAANSTMVEGSVVAIGDAIALNGSVDIIYNCNVINDLYQKQYSYKMISWRQL